MQLSFIQHPPSSVPCIQPHRSFRKRLTQSLAMALNMEDLIGSMQHGFHAGDRGNDLNEIRDQLKLSLGQQQSAVAGPSTQPPPPHSRRPHHPPSYSNHYQGGGSSLDADVAMLSSSSYAHHQQQYGWGAQSHQTAGGGGQLFGGPGSWGSQSSSSSDFGTGFAAAPANTPQQTPVETSALARQLQAELERQPISPDQTHGQGPLSPNLATSPPQHQQQQYAAGLGAGEIESSRNYVNGFSPQPPGGLGRDSATPTGQTGGGYALRSRDSLSPQLQSGNHLAAQQQQRRFG